MVTAEELFTDKRLDCLDCGQPFTWTSGEQRYFRDKGLEHEPKRCKPCKEQQRAGIAAARQYSDQPRRFVQTTVNCSRCGAETTVPFVPTQGRPVYCRSCFWSGQVSR